MLGTNGDTRSGGLPARWVAAILSLLGLVVMMGIARVPDPEACGAPKIVGVATSDAAAVGGAMPATWQQKYDFFTNYGNYIPRTHCLREANGNPDVFWIVVMLGLTASVVTAYLKIFVFWRRCYLEEKPEDRNKKLMDLAYVFLWCAICGYVMSMMMFVWPAYRLLAGFMLVLNFFSWRFASSLGEMRVSLSAKRIQRELEQHRRNRTEELERLVAQRTRELEDARCEALAASEFKSMFLANMSHEIRTPMNAILGFVDLLAEPDEDREHRASHVATIRRNAEHLLGVINDILDLTKIEAGKMGVEPVPTDLPAMLADVRTMMVGRAESKGLSVDMKGLDAMPRTVLTDGGRVRQVLINLIGNAVKFTETGHIDVAASAVRAAGGAWTVRVSVSDTGIGMSQEQVAGLFRPFAQADASITRRFGGTGLGLSISRRMAELLGGGIEVESQPGVGSRFTFTFTAPECGVVSAPAAPAAPVGAQLHGLRLLLAEDGVDNQRLIRHHVTKAGAELVIVENGRLAVEQMATDDRFDAVLMDMQMPEMDGYSATGVLRARGYTKPIIALTAHAMSGDRERCLRAGCSDYLTKPVDRAKLIETIAAAARAGGANQVVGV